MSRRIVVHSLEHARDAVAAAKSLGIGVTLASAAGAAGYAGPLWLKALVEAAAADAGVTVAAVLDCGDEAGTVLAALRAGLKHLRYAGPQATRERLAALAAPLGAEIEGEVPVRCLDLLGKRETEALCRAFLAERGTYG